MALVPAALGEDPSGRAPGVPYSPLYDDHYHSDAGAWTQARSVFLGGNGLPARWRGRPRFVILETGFGLGHNFLATWDAWRQDPDRCSTLIFVSVEKHPLTVGDLARLHHIEPLSDALLASGSADPADHPAPAPEAAALARRLLAAWPTLTPGWHHLDFDDAGGRVSLMLGLGDVNELLPSLLARVDAFYLDGFSPARNPDMWRQDVLSRLHKLAAPQATAATWSFARVVREGLSQAGFTVTHEPGLGSKRDMLRASFEPRHVAPPQPGGIWPEAPPDRRHALVIGAGLAGCSTALALRQAGWRVSLLDQATGVAQGASGNPGGLFHPIVHGEDGLHARALRAAALAAWQQLAPWVQQGWLKGQCTGLLRLDADVRDEAAQGLIGRLGLPADHVRWLSQAEAAALAGIDVPSGGWLFAQAGWVKPAAYAQTMLDEALAEPAPRQSAIVGDEGSDAGAGVPAAASLDCHWGVSVKAIRRITSPQGTQWQALGEHAQVLAQAPVLVLANAAQADRLLQTLPADRAVTLPPLSEQRGQITQVRGAATSPKLPVAGSGYALTLDDGSLLCGATSQSDDPDPTVREADHRHNLALAASLGVRWPADHTTPDLPTETLAGRVGWRATTPDRLPLIGALPWSRARLATSPIKRRLEQVRQLPRERDDEGGLYIVSGLGSRGITWAALAGRLIAHWVAGTPCPVEADLRDAMDPARFLAREARTADRAKGSPTQGQADTDLTPAGVKVPGEPSPRT